MVINFPNAVVSVYDYVCGCRGGRPASVAVVGRPPSQMMDAAHSVLSIPLSHREPTTLSFQVNRGEIYNGQYPHLQVKPTQPV